MRDGTEGRLPRDRDGRAQHTLGPVYCEMLRQICLDYSGLPDARTLTLADIRFFYDGLRPTLRKYTKPKK